MIEFQIYDKFVNDLTDFDEFDNFVKNELSVQNKKKAPKKETIKHFNPMDDLSENKFRIKYRFTKENFRKIIELVRDDFEVDQKVRNQVPIELQIMTAIRYWGGTEHPQTTAALHGVSMRTLGKICKRVACALASKASRYIRMPATLSEKELVIRSFLEIANMPQIIGTVGHICVRLKPLQLKTDKKLKTNKTEDGDKSSILLQVISDSTSKIRDVDCKIVRTADGQHLVADMFQHSRIKDRFEQNEFRGRLLLGNNSLHCTPYLLNPFLCAANESEDMFNCAHAATYASLNNCLNLWMRRFGVLGTEICSLTSTAKQTITSLALLHNLALEWNDPSLGLDLYGTSNYAISTAVSNVSSLSGNRARAEFMKAHF